MKKKMCGSIEEAMEFIKGYCNKHTSCTNKNGNCRLWDENSGCCFLGNEIVPCDWQIEKEGEINE